MYTVNFITKDEMFLTNLKQILFGMVCSWVGQGYFSTLVVSTTQYRTIVPARRKPFCKRINCRSLCCLLIIYTFSFDPLPDYDTYSVHLLCTSKTQICWETLSNYLNTNDHDGSHALIEIVQRFMNV